MGGLIDATCKNPDCKADFKWRTGTPFVCPVCHQSNVADAVTLTQPRGPQPFKQADLFDSDRHRLNLDFDQQTYLRLLSMQYAIGANSKEAVVQQSFAVLEWLIDLAKENRDAVLIVATPDQDVVVLQPLAGLFDTKGE